MKAVDKDYKSSPSKAVPGSVQLHSAMQLLWLVMATIPEKHSAIEPLHSLPTKECHGINLMIHINALLCTI